MINQNKVFMNMITFLYVILPPYRSLWFLKPHAKGCDSKNELSSVQAQQIGLLF